MSADGTSIVTHRPGRNGGTLIQHPKGTSGNPSGMSKERRALLDAIETNCIPKVMGLLDVILEDAMAGDNIARRIWLEQVRGPLKARDDDAIATAVEEQLLAMIQEARRRRADAGKCTDEPTSVPGR